MQVAGERGVFGPFDMSIRARRKMATVNERWAEGAQSCPSVSAQGGCPGLTQAGPAAKALSPLLGAGLQPRGGSPE